MLVAVCRFKIRKSHAFYRVQLNVLMHTRRSYWLYWYMCIIWPSSSVRFAVQDRGGSVNRKTEHVRYFLKPKPIPTSVF